MIWQTIQLNDRSCGSIFSHTDNFQLPTAIIDVDPDAVTERTLSLIAAASQTEGLWNLMLLFAPTSKHLIVLIGRFLNVGEEFPPADEAIEIRVQLLQGDFIEQLTYPGSE